MFITLQNVKMRFAVDSDIDSCIAYDHIKNKDIIQRKIDSNEIMLVEYQDMIIGYLKLEYIWSSIPYISLILLKKEFRGKGIGDKTLKFLEEHLKEKGFDILLSSSQVNEPKPQEWHRKHGFLECGILSGINHGGIGEVFFRKELK